MDYLGLTNFDLYDIIVRDEKELVERYHHVELKGWVRTNRDNGSIGFIEFNFLRLLAVSPLTRITELFRSLGGIP